MAAFPYHHSHYYYVHPAIAGGLSFAEFQGVYACTHIYSLYMPPMYSQYMPSMYFVPHQPQHFVRCDDSWIMNSRDDMKPGDERGDNQYIDDSLILNAQEGEEESTHAGPWEYPWILNAEAEDERYRQTLLEFGHLDLTDREEIVPCDGLSEETVTKHLNSRNFNPPVNAADICVVCQDCLFQKDETIATLDCGHGFHTGCIKSWLMVKNSCPLCKATGICLNS